MQVVQVAAGGMHGAAITADGGVWTWGVNDEGALGRQTKGEVWDKALGDDGKALRVPLPPSSPTVTHNRMRARSRHKALDISATPRHQHLSTLCQTLPTAELRDWQLLTASSLSMGTSRRHEQPHTCDAARRQ